MKIINGDCNRFYVFFVGTKVYRRWARIHVGPEILETIVVNGGKTARMCIFVRDAKYVA